MKSAVEVEVCGGAQVVGAKVTLSSRRLKVHTAFS